MLALKAAHLSQYQIFGIETTHVHIILSDECLQPVDIVGRRNVNLERVGITTNQATQI
jgi:hypothetical protein